MRRYTPLKPSRGTVWPPDVAREIHDRDRGCVGPRIGMPGECDAMVQKDHVRASHGIGMKSRSTADNGVLLCGRHHRVKTEDGRTWRPLLVGYLSLRYPLTEPA